MAAGIIVRGETFPVLHPSTKQPMRVFAWSDPPGSGPRVPEFKAGDGYNKGRTKPVDLCVWHWTGGEAEPDRVAETLRKRKLGIEFAIGRTGAIYQFCDPAEVDTADAGIVNSRSVGVEITCYGYAASVFDPLRALKVPRVPPLGRDRETYVAETHGRKVKTAKFYTPQINAALGLADAISAALGIPRQVPPEEEDGEFANVLWPSEMRFRGHCGHYHITRKKRDPGPWFMDELGDHFEEAA